MRRLLLACVLVLACAQARATEWREETRMLDAPGVSATPMRMRVLLPPGYDSGDARYSVLYVNDGQDMEAVRLRETLARLRDKGAIVALIVVAIDMPPDRMAGYGFFDRATGEPIIAPTQYGDVGANAQRYAAWMIDVVVPAVDARYRTRADAAHRAILGWSLGAASAFGIGWQYPEVFARVGAFSPSFWLATDRRDAASVQSSRIAHALVARGAPASPPKLFLDVGSAEETGDRDGDGVIDVLDDARDLAAATRAQGVGTRLSVLRDGHHDQRSWAAMLPAFLRWAYAAR